jgi:hypothetical protein
MDSARWIISLGNLDLTAQLDLFVKYRLAAPFADPQPSISAYGFSVLQFRLSQLISEQYKKQQPQTVTYREV